MPVFFFFFCPRFSWRLWKKIPLRRKDSMSGLCSSRRTSCPGNISSRVWAAHPLNMTCLQDALSTSVGYERKRIVIKATVEKNVMVYGLNAVWHSSLLALFFFFLHRLYWHILMLQDSEQVYRRHHKSPVQHSVQAASLDSDRHRFNKRAPKPVAPITLIVSTLRRKGPYSLCLWWNALSVSLFCCLVAFTSNRVKRRETVCRGKHGRAQTQ